MQDIGVDVGDDTLMESRSWRWLETRIEGLIDRPPVGFVQVVDPDNEHRNINRPIYSSRVQQHFASGPERTEQAI